MDVAKGLVPASFQVLLDNLVRFGLKEGDTILNVDENLKAFRRTLPDVLEFVLNEEERLNNHLQIRQGWLRDLEDAVYDGEDLVDEIDIELSRPSRSNHNNNYRVRDLVIYSFKLTIPSKVESIFNRMKKILEERGGIINNSSQTPQPPSGREFNSMLINERLIGRDNSASEIMRMLSPSISTAVNNNGVHLIPIVGMAGVGKTALAKVVYDDARINDYFDVKYWLDSNLIILAYAKTSKLHANVEIHSQTSIDALPSNKRILLVLDGLGGCGDQCQQKCDYLVQRLKRSEVSRGTAIIVTTRSHAISSMVGNMNAYHLKPLSEGDCLALLKQTALGTTSTECPENMVSFCGRIAEKCEGLPWKAKMLGSMMRTTMNENEWTAILNSNIWDFPEVPRNNFLSSFNLSALLKRCFAYCTLFPHNQAFCKKILVRLWIAEGFVVPEANMRRIEDIGSKYFDDLLNMSIFLFEGGKYKMHTLIHELAQSVSGNKFFRMKNNDGDLATGVRHLSISCSNIQIRTFENFYKCKGLRTLILLRDYGANITVVPHNLFTKLNSLRVLDLSGSHVTVLTDTLGSLIHLRYFDLSETHIEWLPETISKLYKLLSLNLKNCRCLPQLPKCMSSLIYLRHLELEGSRLTSMPIGFGSLIDLQTLSEFIVGSGSGDARISELRGIKNLQGFLRIKKLENVPEQDISEFMLDNKAFLHKLELQWSEMQDDGIQMRVLESLQPNENLRELTIRKYSGREFPNWVGNTFLPCLVSLRLLECRNCNVLPSLGCLPKLKSLELAEMLMVTSINSMFCADDQPSFPSLESLELLDMPKLSTWSRLSNNDLPSLTKLLIDTCPQLTDLPTLHQLKSLHELELRSCYGLDKLPEEGLSNDLHSVIIVDCPLLLEKYREGGEFWQMIENIPYKEIN